MNIQGLFYVVLLFWGLNVHAQSNVIFCNKTPYTIDSIVVNGPFNLTFNQIVSDSCLRFDYPSNWENTHSAIIFNYKVFVDTSFFTGQVVKAISNKVIRIDNASFLKGTARKANQFELVLEKSSPGIDLSSLVITSPAYITANAWADSSGKVFTFNLDDLRKRSVIEVRFYGKLYKINLLKEDFTEDYSGRRFFYVDKDSIRRQN